MKNEIVYKLGIRRLERSSDPDYSFALKIYNQTTPYEIKTNTNEITFWLDRKDGTDPFEPMFFALYYSGRPVGFAMMTYMKAQRIAILEYISLEAQYRVNTVFFVYINLLENYLNINQYDVAFIINEVSNRRNGHDIDRESQIFAKLLCIEGYSKIDAPYTTPPLGLNNFESSFDAYLFIKSTGDIHALEKQTYLEIVKTIYFEYFLVWYRYILPQNEIDAYQNLLTKSFDSISHKLSTANAISVIHVDCPILMNNISNISTTGLPPATPKKSRAIIYILLVLFIILCPIVVVWIYNLVLGILHISIGSVNAIVGNCLSALLTVCVTLWLAKRKL